MKSKMARIHRRPWFLWIGGACFLVGSILFSMIGATSAGPPPSTVTANQGAAGSSAWKVDGSGVTQPVSGTVGVNNLPATQNVSGSVSANLAAPADQFSFASYTGDALVATLPCGATAYISSFTVNAGGSGNSAGILYLTNATGGPSGGAFGDSLSARADTTQHQVQQIFPQPFALPAAAPNGTCISEQLFEDGGTGGLVNIVGFGG